MKKNSLRLATRIIGTVLGAWMIVQIVSRIAQILGLQDGRHHGTSFWTWYWPMMAMGAAVIAMCAIGCWLIWRGGRRPGVVELSLSVVLGSVFAGYWISGLRSGPLQMIDWAPDIVRLMVDPVHLGMIPVWFGLAALHRYAVLSAQAADRPDRKLPRWLTRRRLPWLAASALTVISLDLGLAFAGAEMAAWRWAAICAASVWSACSIALLVRHRVPERWIADRWLAGGLAASSGMVLLAAIQDAGGLYAPYLHWSHWLGPFLIAAAPVIMLGSLSGHLLLGRKVAPVH